MALSKSFANTLARTKSAAAGIREDVARLRSEIRGAQVRRAEIEAAPVDVAEVERRVDALLSSAESSFLFGGWSSSWLSAPGSDSEWLLKSLQFGFSRQPLGALSYLGGREMLKAALIAEAATGMPLEAKPLTAEQRAKALADADAEIERLEMLEEAVIREAASAGIEISRREDASAAVFLLPDEDLPR